MFYSKQKLLNFEELKEFYEKPNNKCRTSALGTYFIPEHTEKVHIINGVTTWKTEIIQKDTLEHDIKGNLRLLPKGSKRISIEKKPVFDIEENKTIPSQLRNISCNNWSCALCRPRLKQVLYENCLREVNSQNIIYHYIQTFKGGKYRELPYDLSYKIMSKETKKLQMAIYYAIKKIRLGRELRTKYTFLVDGNKLPDYDFSFIRMIRSQNNPKENNPAGFCHYHTGINYPINKKWIDEIIKKNNLKLGWNWITENKNFLDYLTNDFLTDEEYIIPYGIKHYATSRNIHIKPDIFTNNIKGVFFQKEKNTFEEMDSYFYSFNQMLPFEEYIKKFWEINNKND